MIVTATFSLTVIGMSMTFANMTSETTPWSKLPKEISKLCQNVCVWKNQENTSKLFGDHSCCEECSCDSRCGDDRNCCFPELGVTRNVASEYQTCTIPSTGVNHDEHLLRAYHMTDQTPKGGCIPLTELQGTTDQCGDVQVAPWGSMFPVTSKRTGKIYRNRVCAECHGDNDIEAWDVFQLCHQYPKGTGPDFFFDLSAAKAFGYCSYYFEYTGQTNLEKAICHKGALVDHCRNLDYKMPFDLTIPRSEIENACSSGFYSPIITLDGLFANVFCLLCNNIIPNPTFNDYCIDGDHRFLGSSFLTVLKGKDIELYMQSTRANSYKARLACTTNEMMTSDCRPLLCPTGQVRLFDKCSFLVNSWVKGRAMVTLLLKLVDPDLIPDIIIEAFTKGDKEHKILLKKSQWKKGWKVFSVYRYEHTIPNKENGMWLVLNLYNVQQRSPIKSLIDEIGVLMHSRTLTLRYRNVTAVFNQSFNRFEPSRTLTPKQRLYQYDNTLNDGVATYVLIQKTYFCEMIELSYNETSSFSFRHGFYYNATERYFFEREFELNINVDGSKSFRICLEDSNYHLSTSLATTCPIDLYINILIFVLQNLLISEL